MKKAIFILVVIITIMTSCGTTSLVNRAKHLELGMTKGKIVSVMGKDFKVISASRNSNGDLEVVSYNTVSDRNTYIIYFLNGELEKWHEMSKDSRHLNPAHKHRKLR